jgi:hypothetical protein
LANEREIKLAADPNRVAKEEITIFVDLDDIKNALRFLNQTKSMGMTTPKYHYLLVSLVSSLLLMISWSIFFFIV